MLVNCRFVRLRGLLGLVVVCGICCFVYCCSVGIILIVALLFALLLVGLLFIFAFVSFDCCGFLDLLFGFNSVVIVVM